jgi:hypothetical protein
MSSVSAFSVGASVSVVSSRAFTKRPLVHSFVYHSAAWSAHDNGD